MLTYLKITLKQRWIVYFTLFLSLVVLGLGYLGTKIVQDRMIIQAKVDLNEHWRWQYDILVYPQESGTFQGLEDGWVAPQTSIANYGGISLEELELIRQIPGVKIAAPLSLIGYFNFDHLSISYTGAQVGEFYKETHTVKAFDGLQEHLLKEGESYYRYIQRNSQTHQNIESFNGWDELPRPPSTQFRSNDQMLLVAVDPQAEDELYALSSAVIEGDNLNYARPRNNGNARLIPIIALAQQYYQVTETFSIEHVDILESISLEQLQREGNDLLKQLPHTSLATFSLEPYSSEWRYRLTNIDFNDVGIQREEEYIFRVGTRNYITRYSPIHYTLQEQQDGSIPRLYAKPFKRYQSPFYNHSDFYTYRAQRDSSDYHFGIELIGFYDANEIRPQNTVAWSPGQPIDLYTPHHSMIIRDGAGNEIEPRPLIPLPLKDIYYTGAPDAITTLEAAKFFYKDQPPISSVRVVVEGVSERSDASQRKIEQIAQQIMNLTGHEVEIMLGSSASKVWVELAGTEEGEVGIVEEGWQQKGVSWSIEEQIEKTNQWLFIYLAIIILFLSYTLITNSLLKRSTEFALLRAIGWSRSKIIFGLVLEILLLSMLACLPFLFLMSVVEIIDVLDLSIIFSYYCLIICLGYLSGSRQALWLTPRAGFAGEGKQWSFKRIIGIHGLGTYIIHQLLRRPLRFGLLVLVIALSVFMVILFAATQQSLSDYLFITFLGEVVDLNLQTYQQGFLIFGIVLTLVVVLMLLTLNLLERQKELSIMRSIGWSLKRMLRYLCIETFVLTSTGSLLGICSAYAILTIYSSLWLPNWIAIIAFTLPVSLLVLYTYIFMQTFIKNSLKTETRFVD